MFCFVLLALASHLNKANNNSTKSVFDLDIRHNVDKRITIINQLQY